MCNYRSGFIILLSLFFINVAFAQNAKVIDNSVKSTVMIQIVTKAEPKIISTGTGVIIDDNVITTEHTFAKYNKNEHNIIATFHDTALARLELLKTDPTLDFALLKFTNKINITNRLKFTNKKPNYGEDVFTIGFPYGEYAFNMTTGKVSNPIIYEPSMGKILTVVSIMFFQGNSGGAVMNADGDIIGLVIAYKALQPLPIAGAYPAPTVLGLVSEINIIQEVYNKMKNDEITTKNDILFKSTPHYTYNEYGKYVQSGRKITEIMNNDNYDLQVNDIIIGTSSNKINTELDLMKYILLRYSNENLSIKILRNKQEILISKKQTIDITP